MTDTLTTQTLFETILARRSIRRYTDQPVARDLVETILAAGTYAPSAHNRQPWRFAVVQSAEAKETLAQAMGARLRSDLEADHVPEEVIAKDTQRSYDRLTSAPILVMVCLTMADMDIYRDARRNANEKMMAAQSVAMAGQNILLAAHAHGLGACWMCAPLFCPDVVREALQLPHDWQAQGIITLGYPAQLRESTREPLETRLMWR